MDLVIHLYRQRTFSRATFGPGRRTAGICDHIRKELAEIEADPTDISEWIDVILLALTAKQSKNEQREWPDWRTAAPDKAIEHVR